MLFELATYDVGISSSLSGHLYYLFSLLLLLVSIIACSVEVVATDETGRPEKCTLGY